jgi:hypothetical protein
MKGLFVIEARQLMDRHVPVDYFDDEPMNAISASFSSPSPLLRKKSYHRSYAGTLIDSEASSRRGIKYTNSSNALLPGGISARLKPQRRFMVHLK